MGLGLRPNRQGYTGRCVTTIAYRWGVLAADSRAMLGGWKAPYEVTKLFRLPDGSVAGVCGGLADSEAFIRWLAEGEPEDGRPTIEDSTVVRLLKDGSLIIYECGGSFPIKTDFGAWG